MRPLVWFRSDLRIEDNPALLRASQRSDDGIVGVFAVTAAQWKRHDWGQSKADFTLRNTTALKSALQKLHIPLKIIQADTFDAVPEALVKLAGQQGCGAIYYNHEYEVNERRRDESVERLAHKHDIETYSYHDQCIVRPDVLKTGKGGFYTVFTPFKNAWMKHLKEGSVPGVLAAPKKQKPIDVKPDTVPDLPDGLPGESASDDLWPAGEKEAARRLNRFVDESIDSYSEQRDFPATDATSTLSPYLASGVISARTCLAAAMNANRGRLDSGKQGPATWISQLVWRDFYRHVVVGYPRVSMNRAFKLETDQLKWENDKAKFTAWCEGQTGVPIVDSAMRQLLQTGWMHNRLRMVTAMHLTKDLWIDWRWGERHFANHLVDLDLANNNGGWQWAASTGTDAAPYFRVFNPVRQSQRFDPDGTFIRRYCPELDSLDEKEIHDPSLLPPLARQALEYPEAIVDHKTAKEHAVEAFKTLRH